MRLRVWGLLAAGLVLLAACGDGSSFATTTMPATTTGSGSTCRAYASDLEGILTAAAEEMQSLATSAKAMDDGTLSYQEGADRIMLNSDRLGQLHLQLDDLGSPPDVLAESVRLLGLALGRSEQGCLIASRGARAVDFAMINEGVGLLQEATAFVVAATDERDSCP